MAANVIRDLGAALRGRPCAVFTSDARVRIEDFLRGCDTVVWLVSPHSVRSKWCNWELGEVRALHKRLIPVLISPLPPEDLPDAIGKVHLLPAEGAFSLDKHLDALVEALNTDRKWIKEHTRLADRAHQWIGRERSDALLLRGAALEDAERWRSRQPSAAPPPSDEAPAVDESVPARAGRVAAALTVEGEGGPGHEGGEGDARNSTRSDDKREGGRRIRCLRGLEPRAAVVMVWPSLSR